MILVKRVKSSNVQFIPLEVNVDTVYVRFNEEKWYIEDEETKEPIHIGYIYDEEQYDIREYIEKISRDNSSLLDQLIGSNMEMAMILQAKEEENELKMAGMMLEIAQMINMGGSL